MPENPQNEAKSPSKDQKKEETMEIDLSRITNTKVRMIAGTKDSLCTIDDTKSLYQTLKEGYNNDISLTFVEGLCHADLVRGRDIPHFKEIVIPTLLKDP